MGKSVVVMVISLFIMVGGVSARTGSFSDMVQGDWFYDNVSHLVEEGIIAGYPDGTFKPTDTMNVDAFIKTMVVALGEDPGNAEGYWAQNYIDAAMDMGILEEGDFDDYREMITRSEMSLLAVRTVESLEGNKTYKYTIGNDDTLYESISDRGDFNNNLDTSYALYAYELGIITGYPDGTFKPNDGLKRSEAVTVIRRVIDASQRKPYEAPAVGHLDAEAQAIYEETGYRVFTSSKTDHTQGQVITEDQLRNEDNYYYFQSGVDFIAHSFSQGNWGINFGLVWARESEDNYRQQMYEAEYLLTNIVGVEKEIVDEILDKIEQRVASKDAVIDAEHWYPANGGTIYIRTSTHLTKSYGISGSGFPVD